MPATEVITTVMLTGDPQWVAIDMSVKNPGAVLIQDTDANIGIMGSRDQIRTMLNRIAKAINSPLGSDRFKEIISNGR